MKQKEWPFAKTREKLIRMVEKRLKTKKYVIPTAMDIVDACLLEAWEYSNKREEGRKEGYREGYKSGVEDGALGLISRKALARI